MTCACFTVGLPLPGRRGSGGTFSAVKKQTLAGPTSSPLLTARRRCRGFADHRGTVLGLINFERRPCRLSFRLLDHARQ